MFEMDGNKIRALKYALRNILEMDEVVFDHSLLWLRETSARQGGGL
jgi:hypothetical protein